MCTRSIRITATLGGIAAFPRCTTQPFSYYVLKWVVRDLTHIHTVNMDSNGWGTKPYNILEAVWTRRTRYIILTIYEHGHFSINLSIFLNSQTKETSVGFWCVLRWALMLFSIAMVFFSSWLIPHSKEFLDLSLLLYPIFLFHTTVFLWMPFSPFTFLSRASPKRSPSGRNVIVGFVFCSQKVTDNPFGLLAAHVLMQHPSGLV